MCNYTNYLKVLFLKSKHNKNNVQKFHYSEVKGLYSKLNYAWGAEDFTFNLAKASNWSSTGSSNINKELRDTSAFSGFGRCLVWTI